MSTRPSPGNRAEYAAFYPLQTRWQDNDMYGHMNNAVHYSLFDTAVNGWLIAQGVLDPRASDVIGLVVESGCRYFAELGFPAPLEAGLRVGHLGRSSVRYEIGLFAEDSQTAAAEGYFTHVFVDRQTRKPTPLTPELRSKLEALICS
ncbi:Thioesterase superfamily protein [Actibacterium atlanticum]|uniref:Thioesterase superfamily protein n=1 Tax=Actibacterium atlanticum TaxID=1461693 RepID=A0A058ZKG1_9RHOB|nr:thioesterase family protein [Actibacterium atlanticum]KCV81672.1 Thioesterase superfamily protein [Actibacterium atlanticum]